VSLYAGKMSHIRSLLNKASQKVAGQSSGSRKRSECRDQTTDAWFPARVNDDPIEEEEVPLKRKNTALLDKGKQVQTHVPASSKDASRTGKGLFQLPKVWSESSSLGSQALLYLSDSELKAIHDLEIAGRS